MLLRSSSTPVLGSLIPHSDNNRENVGRAKPLSGSANQFSFHSTSPHTQLYSSCDTCSVDDEKEVNSTSNFRRVRSEGNLESLLSRGSPVQAKIAVETFLEGNLFDAFNLNSLNKPWSRRPPTHKRLPSLKFIPSFSSYCNEEDQDGSLENYDDGLGSNMQDFSFGNDGTAEIGVKDLAVEQGMVSAEPMFMARGLGIDDMEPPTDTGGGHGNFTSKGISTGGGGSGRDGYGSGSENVEEYYERMLEDNPVNALVLSNYAQFLYETKQDYHKAEDYYSKAILAQPGEGEVLAQYAKLIWELHGDEERASAYFEQAVQVSPEDCHVQAAYASFLWNTDTEEEDKEQEHSSLSSYSPNIYEIVSSATATVR